MADVNDDLLDGELEGDFGELNGEEEDALLADDDYIFQTSRTQRSVYIEKDLEDKTDSSQKFYHGGSEDDVQDVAEDDVILEDEEDVLDLGAIDELESEIDEGQGQGQQNWRIQEPPDKKTTFDGGKKLNRQTVGALKMEKANVSSSTNVTGNNVGIESDDDDNEERRARFKSERTANSTIISLKSSLKKTLADIPDSLDNVVPAKQMQEIRGNMRGIRRGSNQGRGGNRGYHQSHQTQQQVVMDNVGPPPQNQGIPGNRRGIWRGPNRGRPGSGIQRPMQPPMPMRSPMMGPGPGPGQFPMNQGMHPFRPLPPPPPQQNFAPGTKIHVNPHFRTVPHQEPNIRPEWNDPSQHQNQGPFPCQPEQFKIQREMSWGHDAIVPEPPIMHHEQYYQPEQPQYQQPMQYMHQNPEPQVFHNPEAHAAQLPPADRLVCNVGSRITIQTNFQPSTPASNFEEFPNRPINSGHFSGPNNVYPNQQNMTRPPFQPQQQFPPRVEYQEPAQHQQQLNQNFQGNEWDRVQPPFNPPPNQFYGQQPQQQVFRPPGLVFRLPPLHQQPQFEAPRPSFRGGIRGRLGTPDNRMLNKRTSVLNQVSTEIPFKQPRFEQRKGGPVMSNLHEVKTVEILPPEVLPDTTTEPEEEDEETKLYRLKIEEQKKLREKLMAKKEMRRQQAASEKKWSLLNSKIVDDGPPGVEPEPIEQNTAQLSSIPAVISQSKSVRGGLSQRGRSVHERIDLRSGPSTIVAVKEGVQPMVTVTSSGIRLPTKYKRVKVRTKDGSIIMKRTPVLLDGSQVGKSNELLTKVIKPTPDQQLRMNVQGVQQNTIQQQSQRFQLVNTVRGEGIPVRAGVVGRGLRQIGARGARGMVRGRVIPQGVRGIAPNPVVVPKEVPKKPLTLGQRFAMQKNQQQIEAPQPQTKSNRVVMPSGLVQVTAAVNTAPIPNSCLLTIDNLSASTTKRALLRMAQQVGKIKQLVLDPKLKRAIVRFNEPKSAAMFFQRFQRKMVDLSMINVTVVPE